MLSTTIRLRFQLTTVPLTALKRSAKYTLFSTFYLKAALISSHGSVFHRYNLRTAQHPTVTLILRILGLTSTIGTDLAPQLWVFLATFPVSLRNSSGEPPLLPRIVPRRPVWGQSVPGDEIRAILFVLVDDPTHVPKLPFLVFPSLWGGSWFSWLSGLCVGWVRVV